MARFKRGRPITANALNQTASEAQTGANPTVVQGQVQVGPRGHHIHIPTKYVLPDGAMWAQYTSTQTAGRYNVVEVYNFFSTHTGQIILKVRKPTIPGNDRLAITHRGVGQNELVPVQVSGYSLVEFYYYAPGSALAMLDIRFGTLATSLYAHYVPLGPLLAGDLTTEPFPPGLSSYRGWRIGNPTKNGSDDDGVLGLIYLVPVQINSKAADYLPTQTGRYKMPHQVIYFDSNYRISQGSPGVVEVHKT